MADKSPALDIVGHCLSCGQPSLVAVVGYFECIADPCGAAFEIVKKRAPRWERETE